MELELVLFVGVDAWFVDKLDGLVHVAVIDVMKYILLLALEIYVVTIEVVTRFDVIN